MQIFVFKQSIFAIVSGYFDFRLLLLTHFSICKIQVVLIENKELSLVRAKDRSDELELNNICFIQANLDYFKGTFNIGVSNYVLSAFNFKH